MCYPALCVIHLELSCLTGQSYIYFFSKCLSIYSCYCAFDCILLLLCKMHNKKKNRLIYRSLVSNIKRLIVKEITVTARYSAMPDLSLYIYQKISVNFIVVVVLLIAYCCLLLLCEKDNNNKKRLI